MSSHVRLSIDDSGVPICHGISRFSPPASIRHTATWSRNSLPFVRFALVYFFASRRIEFLENIISFSQQFSCGVRFLVGH